MKEIHLSRATSADEFQIIHDQLHAKTVQLENLSRHVLVQFHKVRTDLETKAVGLRAAIEESKL